MLEYVLVYVLTTSHVKPDYKVVKFRAYKEKIVCEEKATQANKEFKQYKTKVFESAHCEERKIEIKKRPLIYELIEEI